MFAEIANYLGEQLLLEVVCLNSLYWIGTTLGGSIFTIESCDSYENYSEANNALLNLSFIQKGLSS